MFERFTERARQVVILSQDESRAMGHAFIGTEHILLGLLREEHGLAAKALANCKVTVEDVRARVLAMVGQGEDRPQIGQIPFTPRLKKTLELSLREALSLGHNYIGTEHIVLALLRDNESVAMRVLNLITTEDKVRGEVMDMLGTRILPPITSPRITQARTLETRVAKLEAQVAELMKEKHAPQDADPA